MTQDSSSSLILFYPYVYGMTGLSAGVYSTGMLDVVVVGEWVSVVLLLGLEKGGINSSRQSGHTINICIEKYDTAALTSQLRGSGHNRCLL